MPPSLNELAYRWSTVQAGERANAQQYLMELCEALGVERPRGRGHGYEFEHEVKVLSRDGAESSNFIDLYKAHHFVLEAKDSEPGRNTDTLLRKAFGQVRGYVGFLREERGRRGAEYTPREYVDRLIRPTVEEPIRERWTLTQRQML